MLTVILIIVSFPSPTHSFIPGLKTFLFCKSFPPQPFLSPDYDCHFWAYPFCKTVEKLGKPVSNRAEYSLIFAYSRRNIMPCYRLHNTTLATVAANSDIAGECLFTAGTSAGFWLRGNAPLPPEANKKFYYEMVHYEVYMNKCVVSIAPFSTPACPDCS